MPCAAIARSCAVQKVRACPRCRNPVGDGANLPRYDEGMGGVIFVFGVLPPRIIQWIYFVQCHLRSVASRGLQQCAVGRSEINDAAAGTSA